MKILNALIGLFVRELDMNQGIPRGFGVAWQTPFKRSTIVMPLGLNVVAASVRRCLLWVRYFGAQPLNQMPAYHAGLLAGRRQATGEYVNAFGALVGCTTKFQTLIDDAMQQAIHQDKPVTPADNPELWSELQHARLRAARALITARHRLRDLRANSDFSTHI
jgi:hypothetical protein